MPHRGDIADNSRRRLVCWYRMPLFLHIFLNSHQIGHLPLERLMSRLEFDDTCKHILARGRRRRRTVRISFSYALMLLCYGINQVAVFCFQRLKLSFRQRLRRRLSTCATNDGGRHIGIVVILQLVCCMWSHHERSTTTSNRHSFKGLYGHDMYAFVTHVWRQQRHESNVVAPVRYSATNLYIINDNTPVLQFAKVATTALLRP